MTNTGLFDAIRDYSHLIIDWSRCIRDEQRLFAMLITSLIIIAIIIGIATLCNQRKIKKQLRQLLEQKEQETADKPQE